MLGLRAVLLPLLVLGTATGCTLSTAPVAVGPPFLEGARWVPLFDLRATAGPAWAPDARTLALATREGVWVVGVGEPPRRLAALSGVSQVLFRHDGRSVLALAAGTLYQIPRQTGEAPTVLPLGEGTIQGIAEDAQGRRLALVASDAVWVWDPAESQRAHRVFPIPGGKTVRRLTWVRDRELVVDLGPWAGGRVDRVVRVRVGTRVEVVPLPLGVPARDVVPSPRGNLLGFLVAPGPRDGGERVSVAREDGTGRRTLTPPGRYLDLAWAPGGTVVALARGEGPDRAQVELVSALTGARAVLGEYRPATSPILEAVRLVWAPTGMALAVGPGRRQPPDRVWVVVLRRR